MFRSKTVLIVGAGASCEAGLPAGDALKNNIARLLDIRFEDGWNQNSGDQQITQALRDHAEQNNSRDINPYLYKAWRIRDVVPTAAISIDNFLDAHRGDLAMELCGKLGIVRAILDAEAQSKLRTIERGIDRYELSGLAGSWFSGFFQMLTENVAKSEIEMIFDNLSIITFNYDRCIERFLVQILEEYYELTQENAARIVGKLKIYHPYGQVGALPWQVNRDAVPFGSRNTPLLPLAKQIKTFTEGLDDELLRSSMRKEISEAETAVFLGFAFHPTNMNLLTPEADTNVRRIFATTKGISGTDQDVVEHDIMRMFGLLELPYLEQQAVKPEMAPMTCAEFFKRYFRSLSAPME